MRRYTVYGDMRGLLFLILFQVCILYGSSLQAEDLRYYSPREFFDQFKSEFFPEMEKLNPEQVPEFEGVIDFLEVNGIPIIIGTNSNLQTIFELYLPLISRAENLNGPIVGVNQANAVGNLYFIMHDAVHHFVGIPGIRRADLKDKAATREKLIRVMMLKEQVATVSSLADYIRMYWNWRAEELYHHLPSEFEQTNKGSFSYGDMPRDQYVDLVGDFFFGRSVSYMKRIYKHFDVEHARTARNAGVPLPGFDLSRTIGQRLEARVYQAVFAPLAAAVGYYGEVAHKGFLQYSNAMADFMLQDWYAAWSEDFQYGYELEDLEQRALFYLDELRRDRPLFDRSATGNYQRERLRHQAAMLGRRVAEMQEFSRRKLSTSEWSVKDDENLASIYLDALNLYSRAEFASENELLSLENFYLQLVETAKLRFPVEVYVPQSSRQPFIQYENYWGDITGLLLPRYGHNSNGSSPGGVRAWRIKNQQAKKSLWKRLKLQTERFILNKVRHIPAYVSTLDKLSADYEQESLVLPFFSPEVLRDGEVVYLHRLVDLSNRVEFQLEKVLKPQVIEQKAWNETDQKEIFEALDRWASQVTLSIESLSSLYHSTFVEKTTSVKDFMSAEIRLNLHIDESYSVFYELVQMAQGARNPKKYLALIETLHKISKSLEDGASWETRRSLARFIGQVSPVRSQRLHFFFSALSRYSRPLSQRLSFAKQIASFPQRFFDHSKQSQFRIENPEALPSEIKQNAVAVYTINHESGIFDAVVAQRELERMGFSKVIILASKDALPDFKKNAFNDSSVVIAESEKPLNQIQEMVRQHPDERIAVIICPEGNLPSPAVHMPMAAKPGAFVLARKLAERFSGREVFLFRAKLNGLAHQTVNEDSSMKLQYLPSLLVPSDPLSSNDSWVEEQRLIFENWINEDRSLYFMNLNQPARRRNASLKRATALQPYLSYGVWFDSNPLSRCVKALSYL